MSNSSSTPNAWSRPLKTGPPPGLTKASSGRLSTSRASAAATSPNRTTPPPTPAAPSQEAAAMRERFLQLCLSMVGQRVTLTQKDGAVFEGVFHTFTPFSSQPADVRNKYVIKAVKVVNKTNNKKLENGGTVIIPTEQVARLRVASMACLDNHNSNGTKADPFLTDTEISRTATGGRGHGLVAAGSAWTTPMPSVTSNGGNSRAEALMGGSDRSSNKGGFGGGSSAGLRGHIGEWDQFKANEELFDVKASYDETFYTTELDKSQIDRSRMREAERLAREIETTTATNMHVAEERNQVVQGDYDEEDRYSGVLNQKLENRDQKPAVPKEKKLPEKQPQPASYAAAAKTAKANKATAPPSLPPGLQIEKEEDKTEAQDQAVTEPVADKEEKPTTAPQPENDENEPNEEEPTTPSETKPDTTSNENTKNPPDPEKEVPPTETEPADVVAETKPSETKEERPKLPKMASTSKLNPKAPSFTFNPSARSFTPGGGSGGFTPSTPSPAPTQTAPAEQQQPMMDPNVQMAMPPMVGPYMQHPMTGQPAMVPVMNHFPVHYQRPYPGMEHHMQPVPPQPQHVQPHGQDGTSSPTADEAMKSQGETATPDAATQPQPQHQAAATIPQQGAATAVPMQFGTPGYYGVPMQAVPRPGAPIPGYPQMAAAPQMPMVPAGAYAAHHRHMYGIPHQPPPGAIRPNNGYYPTGPQHYHYMMDGDDFRGRGGRGRGRGRIRKSGGRGGRGYNYHNNGGRHTPQHQHISSHSTTSAGASTDAASGGTSSSNAKDPTPAETAAASHTTNQ